MAWDVKFCKRKKSEAAQEIDCLWTGNCWGCFKKCIRHVCQKCHECRPWQSPSRSLQVFSWNIASPPTVNGAKLNNSSTQCLGFLLFLFFLMTTKRDTSSQRGRAGSGTDPQATPSCSEHFWAAGIKQDFALTRLHGCTLAPRSFRWLKRDLLPSSRVLAVG